MKNVKKMSLAEYIADAGNSFFSRPMRCLLASLWSDYEKFFTYPSGI
ncbi:hypothetical protein Q5A_021445 [Serratia inhibens PRI-2C]|nr:hypothetical protein Q5A_021445 [Serratia inhibens PRI-2C]